MGSSSMVVGLSVGIPCGIAVFALAIVFYISTHRQKKLEKQEMLDHNLDNDKIEHIDLQEDLTFDNYQQLTTPQSPTIDRNNNNPDEVLENPKDESSQQPPLRKAKSKKYRSYSYHPSMKAQNSQLPNGGINQWEQMNKDQIPQSQSSSSTVFNNNNKFSQPTTAKDSLKDSNSNGSTTPGNTNPSLPRHNSEQLLQNYFDGIIPVVPNNNNQDTISNHSRNSSRSNIVGDPNNIKKKHLSIFKKTNSSTSIPNHFNNNNTNNMEIPNETDHTDYVKSFHRNAIESNDFHMPIPGNRNSFIFDNSNHQNNSSKDFLTQPPKKPAEKSFYLEQSSDNDTTTNSMSNPFDSDLSEM